MARELEKLAARMHLPLGHGAVIDVMSRLFSDHKGRRRIARGSNEVKTDPSLSALSVEDEKTPITDILQQNDTRTVTVDERFAVRLKGSSEHASAPSRAQRPTIPEPSRAQRPTMPIKEGARSQRPTVPSRDMPIEDRPTPFADPFADLAMRGGIVVGEATSEDSAATITTTDSSDVLPLTSVEHAVALPLTPAPLPAPPRLSARPARIPTGPQLPMDHDPDLGEDAPTVIGAHRPDRDDPTDVKTALIQGEKPFGRTPSVPMTSLSSPPPPPAIYLRERSLATAVVARLRRLPVETTPRNWLLLCGLFVIAVIVACIVALI
jgi:hypothetical protein